MKMERSNHKNRKKDDTFEQGSIQRYMKQAMCVVNWLMRVYIEYYVFETRWVKVSLGMLIVRLHRAVPGDHRKRLC